jgi:hypothetical protein
MGQVGRARIDRQVGRAPLHPPTEVMPTPEPPPPVFVDDSGRRRRRMRVVLFLIAAVVIAAAAVVWATLSGSPAKPAPVPPCAAACHK